MVRAGLASRKLADLLKLLLPLLTVRQTRDVIPHVTIRQARAGGLLSRRRFDHKAHVREIAANLFEILIRLRADFTGFPLELLRHSDGVSDVVNRIAFHLFSFLFTLLHSNLESIVAAFDHFILNEAFNLGILGEARQEPLFYVGIRAALGLGEHANLLIGFFLRGVLAVHRPDVNFHPLIRQIRIGFLLHGLFRFALLDLVHREVPAKCHDFFVFGRAVLAGRLGKGFGHDDGLGGMVDGAVFHGGFSFQVVYFSCLLPCDYIIRK